jgi:hypothetical protein
MSGLDLQFRLAKTRGYAPLVFLTAQSDVRTSVRAMKAVAVDFLIKPFEDKAALLDAVMRGVERDRAARLQERTLKRAPRLARITFVSRERNDGAAFVRTGTQADRGTSGNHHAHRSCSQQPHYGQDGGTIGSRSGVDGGHARGMEPRWHRAMSEGPKQCQPYKITLTALA